MSQQFPPGLIAAPVRAWIESRLGDELARADELTGGASRNSFILTTVGGRKYFLRMDAGHGPLSGTPFTLAREYGVLEFLQGTGVPVAGVLDYSADHDSILMEFVPGHTSYEKIGPPVEEASLRRELMAAVVALQSLPTDALRILGDHCAAPLGRAIPADLAVWRHLYESRVAIRDPLIEFSLNWLVQSVPEPNARPVLVHGDVGPGNFLVSDGHLRALIDWELVRVGHPLEDLACIIARSLGAPFGPPEEHIANYEALSGQRVERATLDFALALILTRWLIGIQMGLSRPSALQNVPMLFAFRQLNAVALVDAFCRRYDAVAAPPPTTIPPGNACRIVFDYSTECLRAMTGNEQLAAADRYKLGGIAALLSYPKRLLDYGPAQYEREFVDRVSELLGRRCDTADVANDALCDHAKRIDRAAARPLVEYFRWWYAREHEIVRGTLGDLANNSIKL